MPLLDIADAHLHYRLDGPADAPVLVLSNSLGTDLEMWAPQIAAFTTAFRVLRYDTRGHGRSSVTPGPYTVDRLGRDVIALLDGLGIERAHFCGISMGGLTGQWLGVNAPARLLRLVVDGLIAGLRATPPEGYAACCDALAVADLREAIATIPVPTLALAGSLDPVTTPADADFIARAVPGAVRVDLAASHLSNVEQADAFSAAVLRFLSA